jgi:hypothetical protein
MSLDATQIIRPQSALSKSTRLGGRNPRACTSCRQVKLRCDQASAFPSPCSRCKRGNFQCRVDPEFKRTRTRHQLDHVTSQLAAIQQALKSNSLILDANHQNSKAFEPKFETTTEKGVEKNNAPSRVENFYKITFDQINIEDISVHNSSSLSSLFLGNVPVRHTFLLSLFEQYVPQSPLFHPMIFSKQ